MYKNIITVVLSCIIGIFLCYVAGIFYYYINLDKDRPYHFKNIESLDFHKKYTSKLHHLSGSETGNENIDPKSFLFTVVNNFENKNNRILIQGDSYVETLTYYKGTYNLLKEFSKKNNVGFINAGIGSYSPSLMNLQLDVLEKDFGIYPNIVVAYFDQSDMGDEICRYKDKKKFDDNNQLIKIEEERYSRNIFNYTKLYSESSILLSDKSNFDKSKDLFIFNVKYLFMKQKSKISQKIKSIKKQGFANRKLKKECTWADIERPLIENNPEEVLYFQNIIENYLKKISTKRHVEKVFLITFPHRANLYPVENQFNQTIFYNVNLANIIENIIKGQKNMEHLNFTKIIEDKKKYYYNNAYIEFDPHLKEGFHYSLFAKKIVEQLEEYLRKK